MFYFVKYSLLIVAPGWGRRLVRPAGVEPATFGTGIKGMVHFYDTIQGFEGCWQQAFPAISPFCAQLQIQLLGSTPEPCL